MTQVRGKYVLLTGGSRGIGPVIAHALARRGAHIALAARSQEGLSQVAESLKEFDVRVVTVPADLAQPDQRHELVTTVSGRVRGNRHSHQQCGFGDRGGLSEFALGKNP